MGPLRLRSGRAFCLWQRLRGVRLVSPNPFKEHIIMSSAATPELDYTRDRINRNRFKTPSPMPGRKVDEFIPVIFAHMDNVVPARVLQVLPLGHLLMFIDEANVPHPDTQDDGE